MRVHHGRLHMGVAEVLLNLPDVYAIQKQMRRKAVAERVHRHRLVDGYPSGGLRDGLLDDRVVQMVAPDDARAGIRGQRAARKHPEPRELAAGVRIFPFECVRQPHASETGLPVDVVQRLSLSQMRAQRIPACFWEQGRAVLAPFATADEDEVVREVHVLDPQLAALGDEEAKAFSLLLAVPLVSAEVLRTRSSRPDHFSAASVCATHLFLDPDTGGRMSRSRSKKPAAYLFGDELIQIAKRDPELLTLVMTKRYLGAPSNWDSKRSSGSWRRGGCPDLPTGRTPAFSCLGRTGCSFDGPANRFVFAA